MEKARRSERLRQKRDRLSDLPDAILLHIMSFVMIKDVVRTSVLSKRWRNLWKYLPDLTLHTSDFSKPWIFAEFVSGFLSRRKGNYPLHTLDFNRHGYFQPQVFTNLIQYVVLHSVKHLKIIVPYNLGLPNCVYSCQSLTSLYLSVSSYDSKRRTRIPKCMDLPALRSLHLEWVGISADNIGHAEPFSACKKLNTLYLDDCFLVYPNSFSSTELSGTLNITNATLVNLTITDNFGAIRQNHNYVISTPKLSSFTVNGSPIQTSVASEQVFVELPSPPVLQIQNQYTHLQLSSGNMKFFIAFFLPLLNEMFFKCFLSLIACY